MCNKKSLHILSYLKCVAALHCELIFQSYVQVPKADKVRIYSIDRLVLSQKTSHKLNVQPWLIDGSTCQTAQSDRADIFSLPSWLKVFKEKPAKVSTEANNLARLSCSKQLLKDVVFLFCSVTKLFTLVTPKNS